MCLWSSHMASLRRLPQSRLSLSDREVLDRPIGLPVLCGPAISQLISPFFRFFFFFSTQSAMYLLHFTMETLTNMFCWQEPAWGKKGCLELMERWLDISVSDVSPSTLLSYPLLSLFFFLSHISLSHLPTCLSLSF